ncbi:hypothetical protein V1508DRAFT_428224 [Lipomyces doorenjongii]|uniref:uncharacterized protein n=1 Tax=Lipomyces doorenjongii TaxID=383834 RepID=UPI0034CDE9E8
MADKAHCSDIISLLFRLHHHGSSLVSSQHPMQSSAIEVGTVPLASGVQHSAHLAEVSTRKRVRKACDACRIKKAKCDGSKPCYRCIADHKICVFTDRKPSAYKLYSGLYVELLKSQVEILQQGMELLVQRINRGDSITSLLDNEGKVSINQVLEKLSVQCTETDALVGVDQLSTSGSIASNVYDIDAINDLEVTELKSYRATKREAEKYKPDDSQPIPASFCDLHNFYPTSVSSSYSVCSEPSSVVGSPADTSSFCTSPNPELTKQASLSFSLAPNSLDLLPLLDRLGSLENAFL